jgi:hypothetical protein
MHRKKLPVVDSGMELEYGDPHFRIRNNRLVLIDRNLRGGDNEWWFSVEETRAKLMRLEPGENNSENSSDSSTGYTRREDEVCDMERNREEGDKNQSRELEEGEIENDSEEKSELEEEESEEVRGIVTDQNRDKANSNDSSDYSDSDEPVTDDADDNEDEVDVTEPSEEDDDDSSSLEQHST